MFHHPINSSAVGPTTRMSEHRARCIVTPDAPSLHQSPWGSQGSLGAYHHQGIITSIDPASSPAVSGPERALTTAPKQGLSSLRLQAARPHHGPRPSSSARRRRVREALSGKRSRPQADSLRTIVRPSSTSSSCQSTHSHPRCQQRPAKLVVTSVFSLSTFSTPRARKAPEGFTTVKESTILSVNTSSLAVSGLEQVLTATPQAGNCARLPAASQTRSQAAVATGNVGTREQLPQSSPLLGHRPNAAGSWAPKTGSRPRMDQ